MALRDSRTAFDLHPFGSLAEHDDQRGYSAVADQATDQEGVTGPVKNRLDHLYRFGRGAVRARLEMAPELGGYAAHGQVRGRQRLRRTAGRRARR